MKGAPGPAGRDPPRDEESAQPWGGRVARTFAQLVSADTQCTYCGAELRDDGHRGNASIFHATFGRD